MNARVIASLIGGLAMASVAGCGDDGGGTTPPIDAAPGDARRDAAIDASTIDAATAIDCTGTTPKLLVDGTAATVDAVTVYYDGIGCCDGIKAVFDIQGPLGAGYELSLMATGWSSNMNQSFDLAQPNPVNHRRLTQNCNAITCPSVTTETEFTGWLETKPGGGGAPPIVSLCVHVVDNADTIPNGKTFDLYLRDVQQQP